eukprot:Hpha_TRINITY_DN2374_c0_g1::TRINITY_DN2374_c0_g1_i1::g.463::m.463
MFRRVVRLLALPPPKHARVRLSARQVRDYEMDGFLIMRGVFTPQECALLQRTVEGDATIDSNAMAMTDQEHRSSKLTLWWTLGDDLYSLFARSRSIFDAVCELTGTEPYHYHSKIMLKEPKVGGSWESHQDFGYWYNMGGTIPEQMMSCVLAIDDHSTENGCMQVLRGSHKFGRINHGLYGTDEQVVIDPVRLGIAERTCERVDCEMSRGDVLLFHSLLIHGSGPNNSDKWRRSLIMAFTGRYAPINREVTGCNIPEYTPVNPVDEGVIMEAGARGHSEGRGDFLKKEDAKDSFSSEN